MILTHALAINEREDGLFEIIAIVNTCGEKGVFPTQELAMQNAAILLRAWAKNLDAYCENTYSQLVH